MTPKRKSRFILINRSGNLPQEIYPSITQAEKARNKKMFPVNWRIKSEKV